MILLKVNLYPHKIKRIKLKTFLILLLALSLAAFSIIYSYSFFLYLKQMSVAARYLAAISKAGIVITGNLEKDISSIKTRIQEYQRRSRVMTLRINKMIDFLRAEYPEHLFFGFLADITSSSEGDRRIVKNVMYNGKSMKLKLWEVTSDRSQLLKDLEFLTEKYQLAVKSRRYSEYHLGSLKISELSLEVVKR